MRQIEEQHLERCRKNVLPHIKPLAPWTNYIIDLDQPEDARKVQDVKDKLKSIDQRELKNKIMQKGTANFVMDTYLKNRHGSKSLLKALNIINQGSSKMMLYQVEQSMK